MAKNPLPEMGFPVKLPSIGKFGQSGIYFLIRDDEVVYVGQAANMRKRIGQHLAEGVKHFDSVCAIMCEPSKRDNLERHYITLFAPPLNQCAVAKEAKYMEAAGLDRRVNVYSTQFMSAQRTANMLGVSTDQLHAWGRNGPEYVLKRNPRKNTRRRIYLAASVIEFADKKAA